jgi:hypothetical protein
MSVINEILLNLALNSVIAIVKGNKDDIDFIIEAYLFTSRALHLQWRKEPVYSNLFWNCSMES